MKIRISLPEDRDFAGRLEVIEASGAVVFGPVPAAGRAHDVLATSHGNSLRNPLRPYGDTPLGTYAVRGVIESGEALSAQEAVLLEPIAGQAALADAHGRFRFLIQGGTGDAGLQATAGGIRLRDRDQEQLLAFLRRHPGRVQCDMVSTAEQNEKVLLDRTPFDRDPPPLPGRSHIRMRSSVGSLSTPLASTTTVQNGPFRRPMFVVPERFGAGGSTTYGAGLGAGADPGSGSDPGISVVWDPGATNTPTPGDDLNPAPGDQTSTTITLTGGAQLLSTAPSSGASNPYASTQNGWVGGSSTNNPFTGTSASGPLASFTDRNSGVYSGDAADTLNPNSYTGTPPVDPYGTSAGNPRLTGRYVLASQGQGSDDDPPTTARLESQGGPSTALPLLLAWKILTAAMNGVSNSSPSLSGPGVSLRSPMVSPRPPAIVSAGAYSRANPSESSLPFLENAIRFGFLNPPPGPPGTPLANANWATATAQTESSINRGIRGQTAELMAWNYRTEVLREVGILAPKGVNVGGLDYLTATVSQLPDGSYVARLNVVDTTSRYTERPFKQSPGAPKAQWKAEVDAAFARGGSFSIPDNPALETAIRNAYNAGQWRTAPVQIDTVDFYYDPLRPWLGQGEMTVNGVPVEYSEPSAVELLAPESAPTAEAPGGISPLGLALILFIAALQSDNEEEFAANATVGVATTLVPEVGFVTARNDADLAVPGILYGLSQGCGILPAAVTAASVAAPIVVTGILFNQFGEATKEYQDMEVSNAEWLSGYISGQVTVEDIYNNMVDYSGWGSLTDEINDELKKRGYPTL